jgi:hypothetical protein
MVVSFLRWALFSIADCLANVRDEMIYELTFPGGNRGARRWCRHTVRPEARVGEGHQRLRGNLNGSV